MTNGEWVYLCIMLSLIAGGVFFIAALLVTRKWCKLLRDFTEATAGSERGWFKFQAFIR